MRTLFALTAAAAACSNPPASAPRITGSTPPYGPLVGGTRITLTGSGFAAEPNRVVVGGREAPLTATIDDTRLEVVIPPGERPGDAELVVLNDAGNARARGVFRYSAPPTITAVSPADIVFSTTATVVTVTGTGFLDEGAGDVRISIDGQPAAEVQVLSDTTLTFVAPAGRPLVRPDLEVVDVRGTAIRPRAFRYRPSERAGLLMFPSFGSFAFFFDPVDNSFVRIPWVGATAARFTAVFRDDDGEYWGLDRSRRYGRIDTRAQRLDAPMQVPSVVPALVRVGGELLAYERASLSFGKLDPQTGVVAPISQPAVPCCGSYGMAHDGTTLYLASRQGTQVYLTVIDPATGTPGTSIPLIAGPNFHIEDMRFFRGTLYASSRDGTLVTIDPATGQTTVLPVSLGRFNAIEVFE